MLSEQFSPYNCFDSSMSRDINRNIYKHQPAPSHMGAGTPARYTEAPSGAGWQGREPTREIPVKQENGRTSPYTADPMGK